MHPSQRSGDLERALIAWSDQALERHVSAGEQHRIAQ